MKEQIQAAVDTFKSTIQGIAAQHANEVLQATIGGTLAINGVAKKPRQVAKPAKAPAATNGHGNGRHHGEKRAPEEIEAKAKIFLDYVTENPGQRIEPISKALNVPTDELKLPIKKLIASKDVKTSGERRATRYWPKGVRPSQAAAAVAESTGV